MRTLIHFFAICLQLLSLTPPSSLTCPTSGQADMVLNVIRPKEWRFSISKFSSKLTQMFSCQNIMVPILPNKEP